MCEFFVKADPILYESRTRTIRIRGVLTSIRLENMVWDLLAEMAAEEAWTTNALIAQFHDEILAHRGEVPNFASFLRVTCMRFMRRQLQAQKATPDPGVGAPLAVVHALPRQVETRASEARSSETRSTDARGPADRTLASRNTDPVTGPPARLARSA